MSLLKMIKAQLGLSATAANNFVLDASADNGTMKLARGNAGATTQDILTVDAAGNTVASVSINSPIVQQGGIATGRMVLATAQNTTSGTSIDFTGIPSWAKRITVMLAGVSTNGASIPIIQLGAGSIESTGYLCTGSSIASTVNSLNHTTGFGIGGSATSALIRHGNIVINQIAVNTFVCSGHVGQSDSPQSFTTAGSKTLSSTLDRIRLTTVNGTDTFDAGSVNILYEG